MSDAVDEILLRENLDLNGFCQMVDKRRRGFNLISTIRVVVVIYYRTLAQEQQQFGGATPSSNQLNAPRSRIAANLAFTYCSEIFSQRPLAYLIALTGSGICPFI
jgi:hypothetical protein